jgi:hypothetical protein
MLVGSLGAASAANLLQPTTGAGQVPSASQVQPRPSIDQQTTGFGTLPEGSVTVSTVETTEAVKRLPNAVEISSKEAALLITEPSDVLVKKEEIPNQFFAFQATVLPDKTPALLVPNDVEPLIDTSDDLPDVLLSVNLKSFHLAKSEKVDKDTRATLRISLNKENDVERANRFDTLFWTVTTGLNLFNSELGKKFDKLDSKSYETDFMKALSNRPIEIPGGVGSIKLEIIKHKEPAWWHKVFTFLGGDNGRKITSALGFPAITTEAFNFIDKVATSFESKDSEKLFASRSLKFAFSKQARAVITDNVPVKASSLNKGIWVLARGRDLKALANAKAYYDDMLGILVPDGVTQGDVLTGNYVDPFQEVTYAVLKAGMKAAKIETTIS